MDRRMTGIQFEVGKQYIVDVTNNGIIPIEEFNSERFFDKDHDDLVFLTDEEKDTIIKNVLDKIRTEITDCLKALDEIEESGFNIYLPNEISGRRLTYRQCLEFIDKAESEKMSKHWIDDADHWICPDCGFITSNPNRYAGCKCPKCGFQDEKDKAETEQEDDNT